MKLSELYRLTCRALLTKEDPQSASFITRNLLRHVTGMTQEQILANSEMLIPEETSEKLAQCITRILNDEPMAYVLGEWEFYGMTLQVDSRVLIPRDDTCAVTALAIKQALFLDQSPRILDLCTGSGCIGLAIANRVKDARVTLADLSQDAMAVAKKNIVSQKLSGRVACVQADALKPPAPFLGKFDLIVSNPPYITTREMLDLPHSVAGFEPRMALHGGEDGLKFYRSIAENYSQALKPGGYLCFEFGMGQGNDVCSILEENGYTILERSRDYQDIERAVLARYDRKED